LGWRVEFDESSKKELSKLDRQIAHRIVSFLRARVASSTQPRALGEALHGERFGELWKYRVGDYRVIAKIEDEVLRVLVVRIGHRREVYR
jgi:mRNA interferase RelE/StbE